MNCVGMALLFVCLISFPCAAATTKPKASEKVIVTEQGNIAEGKVKSEENRCLECHGADGNGQGLNNGAAGKFAKLAGQYPDYITKQIRNFRNSERKSDLMQIMSKSIDDSDAVDIAAYFSSQKKMQGDGSGDNLVGKNLFVTGDVSRGILPCASCHGVAGKGVELVAQTIPVLGGQDRRYLESQLQDWRSGERHNSAGGVMNAVAKQLTDAEVQALTDYISGL